MWWAWMGVADRSMQEGLWRQRLKHSSGRNIARPRSRNRQQFIVHQPIGNSFTIAQQLVIALECKVDRRIHGWGSKLDKGSLCAEAQSLQGCRLRRLWCSITNGFAHTGTSQKVTSPRNSMQPHITAVIPRRNQCISLQLARPMYLSDVTQLIRS